MIVLEESREGTPTLPRVVTATTSAASHVKLLAFRRFSRLPSLRSASNWYQSRKDRSLDPIHSSASFDRRILQPSASPAISGPRHSLRRSPTLSIVGDLQLAAFPFGGLLPSSAFHIVLDNTSTMAVFSPSPIHPGAILVGVEYFAPRENDADISSGGSDQPDPTLAGGRANPTV